MKRMSSCSTPVRDNVCLDFFLTWLQPLAAYLRNSRMRDSNHPCPVTE